MRMRGRVMQLFEIHLFLFFSIFFPDLCVGWGRIQRQTESYQRDTELQSGPELPSTWPPAAAHFGPLQQDLPPWAGLHATGMFTLVCKNLHVCIHVHTLPYRQTSCWTVGKTTCASQILNFLLKCESVGLMHTVHVCAIDQLFVYLYCMQCSIMYKLFMFYSKSFLDFGLILEVILNAGLMGFFIGTGLNL